MEVKLDKIYVCPFNDMYAVKVLSKSLDQDKHKYDNTEVYDCLHLIKLSNNLYEVWKGRVGTSVDPSAIYTGTGYVSEYSIEKFYNKLSNEAKIVESLYNISDELRTDTIDGFETFVFKKRIDPIYKVGNKYIDLERLVSVNDDIRDFRNDKRIIYEVAITTYFQLMDNPLEICFSNRISNADLYDFVKSEYEKLLEIWRKYKEQKEEDLLKLT